MTQAVKCIPSKVHQSWPMWQGCRECRANVRCKWGSCCSIISLPLYISWQTLTAMSMFHPHQNSRMMTLTYTLSFLCQQWVKKRKRIQKKSKALSYWRISTQNTTARWLSKWQLRVWHLKNNFEDHALVYILWHHSHIFGHIGMLNWKLVGRFLIKVCLLSRFSHRQLLSKKEIIDNNNKS